MEKMVQWLIFYRISCIQAGFLRASQRMPAARNIGCQLWHMVTVGTGRLSHNPNCHVTVTQDNKRILAYVPIYG